ncbi:hypothetical protein [Treponema pectinovorum]|uniref:hypothetical protein n=1 Tax=Treponema pectinovorum TaxID=164 RepID=UPI0011F3D37D|nr:hypothetical protein [Treponema pectinovorum]
MRRSEEKQYYAFLEKIIREQKASSSFWSRGSNSYEMDVLMLMNHIAKKKPNLMDKIINNFVDTTAMKNCSKQDILSFMSRTEKGTICKWKDENGTELFLVNNGERFFRQSKQILVFANRMNKGDLELLKKSMYGHVLKKDIQKVYEKIARQEQEKQQQRMNARKVSFINKIVQKKEKIQEHSASDFEKNFKALVREQGPLCIPLATADTMLAFMNTSERKKLAGGLSAIGVTNSLAWEHLLDKWKDEALNPKVEIERSYKKTVKPRKVEVLCMR